MELQKKFGVKRYEIAFQILHKLREAMARPNLDKIGSKWPLELDIIFVGGKTKKGIQGRTDQVPVIIAVEIRRKEIRSKKIIELLNMDLLVELDCKNYQIKWQILSINLQRS